LSRLIVGTLARKYYVEAGKRIHVDDVMRTYLCIVASLLELFNYPSSISLVTGLHVGWIRRQGDEKLGRLGRLDARLSRVVRRVDQLQALQLQGPVFVHAERCVHPLCGVGILESLFDAYKDLHLTIGRAVAVRWHPPSM
jgi:hypothetical protein